MPVVKVDETVIGDGQPGKHTQQLMQIWHEMTEAYARRGQIV